MQANKIKKKYIILSFFTEGFPHDKGENLTKEAIIFRQLTENIFDEVLLFYPRKLIKSNKKWDKILFDKNIEEAHLSSNQIIESKNDHWAKLNFSLWKPYLIHEVLKMKNIYTNSIVIFHDINLTKYPQYELNLLNSKKLFTKLLKNKSIACIKDS